MTEYGQAFHGSDEINSLLGDQVGQSKLLNSDKWSRDSDSDFLFSCAVYRLPNDHWFYNTDEFKRAKKPDDTNPLADYSDDELQAEIERRQSRNDEIAILARKLCADNNNADDIKADFIAGYRDDTRIVRVAKAAIIAGIELQKGREA